MKTAEEIRDANVCKPFPHLAVLSISDIQSIIDESVAHGMTISAEICTPPMRRESEYEQYIQCDSISQCIKQEILTARDNKLWRKTK